MSAGVGEEEVLSSELGTRDLAQYAEYTDYNSEGQVSTINISFMKNILRALKISIGVPDVGGGDTECADPVHLAGARPRHQPQRRTRHPLQENQVTN